MQLDIRVPIGLMFGILGAVLTIYGLVTGGDADFYKRSLSININLWCGLFYLAFAATMLFWARRGNRH